MLSILSLVSALLLLLPAQVALAAQIPTAALKNGTYTGKYVDSFNQDIFLGIPYAQPPVGDLRFQNPQSLNTSFGTKQAVDYADSCVGYGVSVCP